MNEILDFIRIRELSNDYYQQRITKEEYRNLRKELLDKIDKELNYIDPVGIAENVERGFVDKLMSYFKNRDEEKMV